MPERRSSRPALEVSEKNQDHSNYSERDDARPQINPVTRRQGQVKFEHHLSRIQKGAQVLGLAAVRVQDGAFVEVPVRTISEVEHYGGEQQTHRAGH